MASFVALFGKRTAPGDTAIVVDSASALAVNTEVLKATYSASINAHAPAATPTDWFTILGSATKTIRIVLIRIAGRATAAASFRVGIRKYSTVYTSGTSGTVTIVPLDSGFPAATAVVKTWAAGLPTVGTLVGSISDDSLPITAIASPVLNGERLYEFGKRNGSTVVLRGAGEYVSLNSGGAAVPSGGVFDVTVEWTEE